MKHILTCDDKVFAKRLREVVNLDESQFGFMPGKGIIDALSLLKKWKKSIEKKIKACTRGLLS